jgi:hypothetical protein
MCPWRLCRFLALMATPSVQAQMPRNVRPPVAGLWAQAVPNLAAGVPLQTVVDNAAVHGQDEGAGPLRFVAVLLLLIAGALLLSDVLGLLQGGGVSVLPGIAFALAVLRAFGFVEARNWFDR